MTMATKAVKYEDGKLHIELVPPETDIAIAEVLGLMNYDLKKYPPNNWRKGLPYSKYYAALRRHLLAWWTGEDIDPESGLPHLHHALCNLSFLSAQNDNPKKYKRFDDRVKIE